MIWAERMYAGLDFPAYITRAFERLMQSLRSIEEALLEWRWLDQLPTRPIMLADCRLWECVDVCRTIFGEQLDFASLPTLETIHQRYSSRTAFSELLAESPCPITAHTNEPEVIALIQSTLAG